MPRTPKVISVFLDSSPSGLRRASHAVALAQRWGSHLIGVHVVYAGVHWPTSLNYVRGDKGIEEVSAYRRRFEAEPLSVTRELGQAFEKLCMERHVSCEYQSVGEKRDAEQALGIAFFADLAVVGQPAPNGLPDNLSVTRLMINAGSPILIIPNGWMSEAIGNRVLIGWNASLAARRATGDAMAFVVSAENVTTLSVLTQARQHGLDSKQTGIDLYLDRNSVLSRSVDIPANGDSVAAELLRYAHSTDADLLIVGAYSHARATEALFGGTTRSLLQHTTVPTFLSR